MRYFIALALAALMTSGIFYMTPAFAADEEPQQEQAIEEEGQQEDVQMIEEGEAEQMQSEGEMPSEESEQGK